MQLKKLKKRFTKNRLLAREDYHYRRANKLDVETQDKDIINVRIDLKEFMKWL